MNFPNSQIVAPVNGCARNVIRFDLELFNGYSDVDFLNALCYKLNEVIDSINITQQQFEKIIDFVNNMLKTYTEEQLNEWLSDGTIIELLSKYLNFIVTPQMYGAKGDGKNDDTLALQNALNSSNPVFIPSGVYLITNSIILPSKAIIIGCGKKSLINYSGNNYCFETVDKAIGIIIRDIRIYCNDKGSGIKLYNSSNTGLEEYDVQHKIINTNISHGITAIEISNYCRECVVDTCYIDVMTENGIYVIGTDNKIINCTCGNISKNGFYILGNNNIINNCKAFLCGKSSNLYSGFYIEGNFTALDMIISQQNYTNGIILKGNRCLLANVLSEWNNFSDNTNLTADIQIQGSYNRINGNIITGNNFKYTKYCLYFDSITLHDNDVNITITRADFNTNIITGYDTSFFNESDVTKIINSININGVFYKPQSIPLSFRVDAEKYDYEGGYTKNLETITITNNFTTNATQKYGSSIRMNIPKADLNNIEYVVVKCEQGGKTNTPNRITYASIEYYNKNGTSYNSINPDVALNSTTLSEYCILFIGVKTSKITNDLSIWLTNFVNKVPNIQSYCESSFRYVNVYLIPKGV